MQKANFMMRAWWHRIEPMLTCCMQAMTAHSVCATHQVVRQWGGF